MEEKLVIASGIGIILSAIFALMILQKKHKVLSDFLLFFWFLMFATHLSLIWTAIYYPGSLALPLAKSFSLIHGPLLFIYTESLFRQRLSFQHFLHFLPFLIISLLAVVLGNLIGLTWEAFLLFSKLFMFSWTITSSKNVQRN